MIIFLNSTFSCNKLFSYLINHIFCICEKKSCFWRYYVDVLQNYSLTTNFSKFPFYNKILNIKVCHFLHIWLTNERQENTAPLLRQKEGRLITKMKMILASYEEILVQRVKDGSETAAPPKRQPTRTSTRKSAKRQLTRTSVKKIVIDPESEQNGKASAIN